MPRARIARTGDIQYDGHLPPHRVGSGRLTNAAAAQYGTLSVAEDDLYIERAGYYIDTQFTHASSKLNVGSVTDDDAYIDGIVLQNIATGYYEIDLGAVTTISRIIPKGTVFGFSLDAADTTGKITAFMIVRAYNI